MRTTFAHFNPLETVVALLAVFALGVMIIASSGCGPGESAPDAADEDDHQDPDTITLSDQARESINLDVRKLTRSNYAKSIRIPGQIVAIPGATYHDVTTKTSGEISKIYVFEGQMVKPGEPLFDIELTHQEAIQYQLELLEALAKLEVVSAELERLRKLEKESPNAVERTKIRMQVYEQNHLNHTIDSRRQILVLLGLAKSDVEELIKRHREHHHHEHADGEQEKSELLIETVRVTAPTVVDDEHFRFTMQRLSVHQGQHVDVGDELCQLADLRRLYIEGQAFQRDLTAVREAMSKGWKATAAFQQRDGLDMIRDELNIEFVKPMVDPVSRSARFCVALPNEFMPADDKPSDADMSYRFLPGQRVELTVPTHQFNRELVVPVEAVARDGFENFIFQVSDNTLVRFHVGVLYRDDKQVVLAKDAEDFENKLIAMSGAYQLQLSLLNRQSGPVQHSHGGGAGHSH